MGFQNVSFRNHRLLNTRSLRRKKFPFKRTPSIKFVNFSDTFKLPHSFRCYCCGGPSLKQHFLLFEPHSGLKIMAQAPPLDPPLYSLGWVLRYTISLVVKLNEDLNFLLCCAIDVGERLSVNLFTSRF